MTARARWALTALLALAAALSLTVPAAHAQRLSGDAKAAIVMEPTTGKVAYAKNASQSLPIGSTTKLMTALLVLESGDLSDVVTVGRYRASPAESVLPLVAGERMTVADLLRALLLRSANDAAVSLAVHDAGSVAAFVRRMNRRAEQLGMKDTTFGNPIGLDTGGNVSSARDLAKLAVVLRKNRVFRRIVNSQSLTLRTGARTRQIDNRNKLLGRFNWVDGVKTGYTGAAGYCMVASGRKRGVSMIAVELGASSEAARDDISVGLLNYGLRRFQVEGAIAKDDVVARIPIEDRAGATLPVVAARTVRRVIPRGARYEFTRELPKTVEGPIAYNEDVGKLRISLEGKELTTVTLRANLEIPAASPARKVQDSLLGPWTLIVLGGALLLGAALAMLRRGPPAKRGAERDIGEAEPT